MPPTLVDYAVRALHPRLQKAYALTKNVSAVLDEAEELLAVDILGRVGVEPSLLTAVSIGRHVIRIDCDNTPEFWMEIDLKTLQVRGRVPDVINDAVGSDPVRKLVEDRRRREDDRQPVHWNRVDTHEIVANRDSEVFGKAFWEADAMIDGSDDGSDDASDDEDPPAVGTQIGPDHVGTFVARRLTVTQTCGIGTETLGEKIFVQHTTSPMFWLEISL